MLEGYNRHNRAPGDYFRLTWTLIYNSLQALHTKNPQFLHPQDVLLHPGEKKKRKTKETGTVWTPELMMEAARKASTPPPEAQ